MTNRNDPDVELLFTTESIDHEIRQIGEQLASDLGDDALLVSLLSDSVILVADLVRAIQKPVRFEFIQVDYSPRDGAAEILQIEYPIPFELRGTDLLLVRDLTTTGVIESYLVQQLSQLGARRVRVLSLVDIPARRTTDLEPTFPLLTLEKDVGILVGYGLKYGGRFGNLPYIGRLRS
jgi:hypoxanthine phosphoribosyltransferase